MQLSLLYVHQIMHTSARTFRQYSNLDWCTCLDSIEDVSSTAGIYTTCNAASKSPGERGPGKMAFISSRQRSANRNTPEICVNKSIRWSCRVLCCQSCPRLPSWMKPHARTLQKPTSRRVNTSIAANAQLNFLLYFMAVAWQKLIRILANRSDEIIDLWPKWL